MYKSIRIIMGHIIQYSSQYHPPIMIFFIYLDKHVWISAIFIYDLSKLDLRVHRWDSKFILLNYYSYKIMKWFPVNFPLLFMKARMLHFNVHIRIDFGCSQQMLQSFLMFVDIKIFRWFSSIHEISKKRATKIFAYRYNNREI